MSLCIGIYQYISQINIVSKFEVHLSSKVVMMYWNLKDWGIELYRLNIKKDVSNCESCMDFIYRNYIIFCGNIMENICFISFCKTIWPKFDIIVIIMW
jgi:hypothetical protein